MTLHRYRSHTCGALTDANAGQTVRLSGWVHRIRDHGGLLFIDLRDHYGITQCVVDPDSPAFAEAEKVRSEWVLRIDGHTDKRPINTAAFPSNWELSTARAINVARFLVENGLPAGRVAAAGFAEFRPLDPGESEEAYRRNRRIELQLTNF